ncbi:hypothetical protein PoB_004196500 [Plakobranchus ocellatus]|uniref:Uncharacterized protein n=1 Tax=Plakobranchus ocellatus TaxID=259542 RepID=A0AAV4B4E1_9GAST|nr:hypothetical protein PoB_004196500 [Plakobranchus ocellatus]
MAKLCPGWCLYHIALYLLVRVPGYQQRTTTEMGVTLTREDQCALLENNVRYILPLYQYKIGINFDEKTFSCPIDKRGFGCGIIMTFEQQIDALGAKICVDLRGVAASIPNTQFSIIVSDENGEIQRVYTKSRRFEREPYNIQCPERANRMIKVVLRALSTVKMCPDILPTLKNHNTSLGTIFVKQEIPAWTLLMQDCRIDQPIFSEGFSILKVFLRGDYPMKCQVPLQHQTHYRNSCLSLEYMSQDFRCGVQISVKHWDKHLLTFKLPRSWNPAYKASYCFIYPATSIVDPVIVVHRDSEMWGCQGKFALGVTFKESSDDLKRRENIESHRNHSRNLYMAVFISIISACIFIMTLTFVCCLRMRRTQQRRRRAAVPRTGLIVTAGVGGDAPDGNSPAFWSSTSSDQVFGLPTYEEATHGVETNPSVTSSSPSLTQADKPPAYEMLFTDDGMISTSSTPPHSEQSLQPPSYPPAEPSLFNSNG